MFTYLKLGGILALVMALFGGGFYFGGLRSKAALEALQAEQSQLTAKSVLAERASGAAELARVNAKLKEFEDAPIDPIVPGIARRVFIYANAAGCSVSSAGATSVAASEARGVSRSDPELERLSQDAFDAAGRDAARLNLCREVWPIASKANAEKTVN